MKFLDFGIMCSSHPNAGKVQHPQNHIFPIEDFIRISTFFQHPSLDLHFSIFWTSWIQKARFWEPLGAQLGDKMAPQNHPSGSKTLKKKHKTVPHKSRPGVKLLPRSFWVCSWAPFLSTLDRFSRFLTDF